MTSNLLVSVRNASEASLVSRHSVSVVDVKEPNLGSLGCVSEAVLAEIAASVPPATCLSVALGELSNLNVEFLSEPLLKRFSFAKIGLANALAMPKWKATWANAMSRLPVDVNRVAVAYLDHASCGAPDITQVVNAAIEFKCHAVLMDTYRKNNGNLFAQMPPSQIKKHIDRIQSNSMLAVVAGSIDNQSLSHVLQLAPDLVGVRGALCKTSRTDEICANKLKSFVKQIQESMPTFAN